MQVGESFWRNLNKHSQRITFLRNLRKIVILEGSNNLVYLDESGFEEYVYKKLSAISYDATLGANPLGHTQKKAYLFRS